MAIGLNNYPNIEAADSDYPNGSIKDNDGTNNGTPVNKLTYNDIHQVFAKLLRLADITPSGLPENEYSGFQYIEAMYKLLRPVGVYTEFDRSVSLVVGNEYSPVVEVIPTAPNLGDISLIDSTDGDALNGGTITVVNSSSNSVNIFPGAGASDEINYVSGAYVLASGARVTLMLAKTKGQWIILSES